MIGPCLVISADPPFTLLSVGDAAPGLSYPVIAGVGVIHQSADGAETANVSADLDNADGFVSKLLAVPPLGAVAVLYGPDGAVWFRGIVAGVLLAETASISLEG